MFSFNIVHIQQNRFCSHEGFPALGWEKEAGLSSDPVSSGVAWRLAANVILLRSHTLRDQTKWEAEMKICPLWVLNLNKKKVTLPFAQTGGLQWFLDP